MNITYNLIIKGLLKLSSNGWSVLFLLCFLCGCSAKPADDVLIQNFSKHKSDFEILLSMFQSDKEIERIAVDFIYPCKANISQERIDKYRDLFKTLGITQIEGYGDKRIIFFHVYASGICVTGTSKGYAYTIHPPDLIVNDLDKYYIKSRKSSTFVTYIAYRHITGNWYLYHIVDD
jgi:hypothetical protein